MPNTERIETLISPEALKQFEQLKASTDANTTSFEKLIAKAVELNKALGNASTYKEINKATVEMTENEKALAKQIDDLAKANAKMNALLEQQAKKIQELTEKKKKGNDDEKKGTDDVAKAREKLKKSYSDEAKELAGLKVKQQERNQALKEEAQLNSAAEGSLKQKQLQIKQLQREYDNLSAAERESARGQEMLKSLQELDKELKHLEGTTGRFQRNVGNYSGALSTLRKALDDVSKRIDENTKSGLQNSDVMDALYKEHSLLESLVNNQATGFASVTAEIKSNTIALQQMAAAGLEGTEAYQELFRQTAALKDEAADLKTALNNAAPDDVAFNAAADAAKGLIGVYGLAQSVTALFGDENKELTETLVKLQAAETALQSIEAIRNVFKKENAVLQLKTIALQKVEVIQTNLETAAESRNIAVKYAAIVAQKALNFATSAAGGPLLILIGLLAIAATSFAAYGDGVEDAAKQNERLNRALEQSNNNIDKGNAAIASRGDKVVAQLEERFATEEEIRKQREKSAQEEVDNIKRINDTDARNREKNQKLIEKLTAANFRGDLDDDEKQQLEEAKRIRDGFLANLQKQIVAENELEILRLENSRANKEEIIEAKQNEIEAQKSQLQTSLQLQQGIADNERKTQKDRVNALKEAQRLQAQIINADANSKRLDPTLTPSEIKVIEAQRAAALTQARRESNKAIEDLNRSYAERERQARFDIIRTEIEDQIKAADLIAQTETNSFDKRTDALYAGYEKRRQLIIAQHELDIQNDTLTAEERVAIEKKYISDINGLTVEYGQQQQALYQQNGELVNAEIEKQLQKRLDTIAISLDNELLALNEARRNGLVDQQTYEEQRASLESKTRLQSLQQEINNATAKVLATKEGTAARAAAEKELKDKTLQFSDELNNQIDVKEQLRLEKTKKTIESIAQAYQNMYSTIGELLSISIDKETAENEQRLVDIDRRTQKEIEAVNASVASEQEKKDKISEINMKAAAERELIERRQRQLELERARFEKASNIANIITGTALAVVNALGSKPFTPANIALAAGVGILGAAQLARAIAAPLPKFAEGTTDAPGGLAWVGDGGKSELMVTPKGELIQTPSVPTVMNVPKHSIVLPDAQQALRAMRHHIAINQTAPSLIDHGRYYKEMTATLSSDIKRLEKTVRNKKEVHIHKGRNGWDMMTRSGNNTNTYLNDNLQR